MPHVLRLEQLEFMLFTNDLDVSRKQSFAQTHQEFISLLAEDGIHWSTKTRYAGRVPLTLAKAD
jgi:hypothetical protein